MKTKYVWIKKNHIWAVKNVNIALLMYLYFYHHTQEDQWEKDDDFVGVVYCEEGEKQDNGHGDIYTIPGAWLIEKSNKSSVEIDWDCWSSDLHENFSCQPTGDRHWPNYS